MTKKDNALLIVAQEIPDKEYSLILRFVTLADEDETKDRLQRIAKIKYKRLSEENYD